MAQETNNDDRNVAFQYAVAAVGTGQTEHVMNAVAQYNIPIEQILQEAEKIKQQELGIDIDLVTEMKVKVRNNYVEML